MTDLERESDLFHGSESQALAWDGMRAPSAADTAFLAVLAGIGALMVSVLSLVRAGRRILGR